MKRTVYLESIVYEQLKKNALCIEIRALFIIHFDCEGRRHSVVYLCHTIICLEHIGMLYEVNDSLFFNKQQFYYLQGLKISYFCYSSVLSPV